MKPISLEQTKRDDGTVKVDVTYSADDAAKAIKVAYRMIAYSQQIQAPEKELWNQIIEKVGEDRANDLLRGAMIQALSSWTISALDFDIIMEPQELDRPLPVEGETYSCSLLVTPLPEYELSSYDPVEISVPEVAVGEAAIDQQLEQIAASSTEYVPVKEDRPVQNGDHLLIAIETNRHGEPVPGLTADRRFYDVGEGWLSESFEKNLIGMKAGETKSFEFDAEGIGLTGEKEKDILSCTLTVNEIQSKITPAINDAWVEAKIPNANTLAEFREVIREQLAEAFTKEQADMKAYLATQELAKRLDVKIPDEVYEYAQAQMIQDATAQAQQQGMTLEQMLQAQGMDQQQFSMYSMIQIRANVTQTYALDAWYRHFNLEIDNSDIDHIFQQMAGQQAGNQMAMFQMRSQYEMSGGMYIIRQSARRYKASKHLAETANVTYVKVDQETGKVIG